MSKSRPARGTPAARVDFSWSTSVPAPSVANENCVSCASDTRVTDGVASLSAISRIACERRGTSPGTGSRGSCGLSGRRCTCTVASVMIPSRPSLPSIISRTLGPVDVAGTGRVTSTPAGVTTRTRAREVGDVAVLVGLHARRARRDPAAERRVGEAVGEVAERPALRVELLLERRAEHAGLDPGEARHVVDLEHAVHAAHVDARRPCAPRRPGASRLPEMFVPPPNGITTASASSAARMIATTSSSCPGRR